MLHRHVEALLEHRVVIADVGAWANVVSCACIFDVVVLSVLKPLFACIEHDSVLQMLVPRLVGGGGCARSPLSLVLPGPGDLELETLAIEDLIVVEARRGSVEADSLSGEHFIIGCSHLFCPFVATVNCPGCTAAGAGGGTIARSAYLTFLGLGV